MDPAGYRRYDGLVQTVTSIDASAVARIYQTIRPRLSEAYRGMGMPTATSMAPCGRRSTSCSTRRS